MPATSPPIRSRQVASWRASLLIALWLGPWLGAVARATEPGREGRIVLRSGILDPGQPATLPGSLSAPLSGRGAEVLLVKYAAPVSAATRQLLDRETLGVLAYLGRDTFLIRASVDQQDGLEERLGAAWLGPWHPAYKISPSIAEAEERYADELFEGSDTPLVVMVFGLRDAPLTTLDTALGQLVGNERVVGRGETALGPRLRLLLTPAELVRWRDPLARLDEVAWIDLESHLGLLNDTTLWVAQSGTDGGQSTPLFDHGLHGEGQVIGIIDTGIDPDMCFFRDPLAGPPPRNECDGGTLIDPSQRKLLAVDFLWSAECAGGIDDSEWDTHDHGSHVAGTAAGDDLANPVAHDPADGMAPAAKLVIQDGGLTTDNCADLPGLGCPVVALGPIFQQAYDQGVRIHTNSWGDQENAAVLNVYTARSQDADLFMWQHPDFLLFFAAGNAGPGDGTVSSPSTAKNVISVGATLRGSSAESMASFSSCGPTDDGRIKPDLTLPGSSILSANNDGNASSDNCTIRSLSGTSMASPAAAGMAALARQYFSEGWYPSGAPLEGDAFTPSAALVKAVLVTSARGMSGAGAPIPSSCQGWGRITLDDTLYFPGEPRRLWVLDEGEGFGLGSIGSEREFTVAVHDASEPLEIVLAWTDFPSDPAAGSDLVNDLDLTVVGPDGTFLGNVFSAGESVGGGSADRLNNLEQVRLDSPSPGDYSVRVSAFDVPMGPQPFALVVSGNATRVERLFDDGFESGDVSLWSVAVGSVSAAPPPVSLGE